MDVETTGLDPRTHAICQFGATFFTSQSIFKTMSWDVLVDEEHIASAEVEALQVNGFTPDRMRLGKPISGVFRAFQMACFDWCKIFDSTGFKWYPCFHNAPFDVSFLKATGAIEKHSQLDHLTRRVLDTITMGWMLGQEELSLKALADAYLFPSDLQAWDKHDAGSDSLITARIVQEIQAAGIME
jgi:DNA polymerase III epsilon subunit-like protein